MDVRLPNGTIIRGIPEGTNKWAIVEKAIAAKLATPEDFGQESSDPTEGMGAGEKFLAGAGQGMTRVARSVANLVGVDNDREMANAEERDAPLLESGAGAGGALTGEIAATLPAGGVAAGGRALAARALPRAAAALKGTTTARVLSPAVEGAAVAAAVADPEDRGEMAAFGAGLGGAFGAAGKLIGSAVRGAQSNMFGLTDEAKELMARTGKFVPLSHALKPGLGKQFYEAFLANLPGVGGKIRQQYDDALEDLRRYAGEQAHPPRANLVISPKDDVRTVFGKLEDYWKTAFDDIGKLKIRLFTGAGGRRAWAVPDEVTEALKRESNGHFVPPPAGTEVTGEVLVNLRRAAQELVDDIGPDSVLKSGTRKELEGFIGQIDDTFKQNLDPTGKGRGRSAEIFREYTEKLPYYRTFQDLQSAGIKAASDAEFLPKQLAETAARRAGRSSLRGGAPDSLQEVGRLAKEVLPNFPSRQGLFQTVAALGLGGSMAGGFAAGGPLGAAGGAAALITAMKPFATQRMQKLLSGQYDMLNRYSRGLRRMGQAGRHLSVVGGVNAQR